MVKKLRSVFNDSLPQSTPFSTGTLRFTLTVISDLSSRKLMLTPLLPTVINKNVTNVSAKEGS